ncbi:MAG: TauD/TfdA family dioxygenase [Vulcanimicrobiaceae bacterium]
MRRGAMLFSGLGTDSAELFAVLSSIFFEQQLEYVGGDSPRTRLSDRVYTSTEYPAQYAISLHNELSYANKWPAQLMFCCTIPAEGGGETPIADSRAILRELDPAIRDEFVRRGLRYLRNLHGGDGFGRSWQQTFETEERAAVERYCAETSTDFEWKADGGLRLIQTRPATATHPRTGDVVWFNQADQYHPSNRPKALHESLVRLYGDDPSELPTYVTFADGGTIATEMLDAVRQTVAALTVASPWQRGDALWIDNMLTCHGRTAYRGKRQVLVSMS